MQINNIMTKEQLIRDLTTARDRTLAFFDLPPADLSRSYGPGKWTVRQILHHITDADTVMYDRIRRAIAEPRQVIWAFDQDRWCQNLDYQSLPLELNRDIFRSVRNMVIHLTGQFYDSHGAHEFVHSEVGIRTLKDELEKVAWHNEGHLKQIEIALKTK